MSMKGESEEEKRRRKGWGAGAEKRSKGERGGWPVEQKEEWKKSVMK
jgi:hypothetical protein